MAAAKMHADEVETGVELVRRLVAGQFRQWAALPIEPVEPAGTDNAIYRLGKELVVRGLCLCDVWRDVGGDARELVPGERKTAEGGPCLARPEVVPGCGV